MAKLVTVKAVVYIEPPYNDIVQTRLHPEFCRQEREEFRDKCRTAFTWENRWRSARDTQIMVMGRWIIPDPPPAVPPGYTTPVPLQHQPTVVHL